MDALNVAADQPPLIIADNQDQMIAPAAVQVADNQGPRIAPNVQHALINAAAQHAVVQDALVPEPEAVQLGRYQRIRNNNMLWKKDPKEALKELRLGKLAAKYEARNGVAGIYCQVCKEIVEHIDNHQCALKLREKQEKKHEQDKRNRARGNVSSKKH